MQIQEQTTNEFEAGTLIQARTSTKVDLNYSPAVESDFTLKKNVAATPFKLFESMPRTTFTERFPLLTCIAISGALLIVSLLTEIELLKGSGYFWRW